jgi:zinc transport system substrate-binding protein
MQRHPTLLVAALAAAAFIGCGDRTERDSRPAVAVSVLPFAYVVDRLAGELVETVVMIPPGASPTQYQPTVSQLRDLARAALYVKVGHPSFPFEAAWLDRLLAEAPGIRVVNASADAPTRADDPHIWLAPPRIEAMAEQLESALAELLPAQRGALRANLVALRSEIRALDAEIRSLFAGSRRRRFLVHHPAWGHFAATYGLEQIAIERHHKEPDPYALGELIAAARRDSVRVVFIQPQLDPAPAETVAREIGARLVELDPLAYDWPANLRRAAQEVNEGLFE